MCLSLVKSPPAHFYLTASSQIIPFQALRMLGVSEEELDVENEKILGSLGVDGRKRSFRLARSVSAPLARNGSKRSSWFSRKSSTASGYTSGVPVGGARR